MSTAGPGLPRPAPSAPAWGLGEQGGGCAAGRGGAGRLTVCWRSGMPMRTTTALAPGPSIPAPGTGPGLPAAGSGARGGSARRPGPPFPPARAPSAVLCGRGPGGAGAGAGAGDRGAEGSAGAAAAAAARLSCMGPASSAPAFPGGGGGGGRGPAPGAERGRPGGCAGGGGREGPGPGGGWGRGDRAGSRGQVGGYVRRAGAQGAARGVGSPKPRCVGSG